MSVIGWIITGLIIALFGTVGIGGIYINYERKQAEREKERIRQEGAENAQNAADAITHAEEIKENANTGNHSDDLHTMANQLHNYANGRQ